MIGLGLETGSIVIICAIREKKHNFLSIPMCSTHSCSIESLQLDRQNSIPDSVFTKTCRHAKENVCITLLHKTLTSLVSEPHVMYPS